MPPRIMLADDHRLFAEGLQYLLKTHGIEVTGVATSAREALDKARALKPDIILMDIIMPEYSGMDALKLIKAEMPAVKIVMLTTSEDDEHLFEAIKLGASGYLLKSLNSTELVNMINDLQKGEVPLSPGLAAKLFHEFRSSGRGYREHLPDKLGESTKLTERQMDVLELVAKGNTYGETGEKLGLTERTIKYHMGRIIELLHMENRAQVIAYASKIGLVNSK